MKGMHKMPDGSTMKDHAMGPQPKGKKAAPMMMIVIAGKPVKKVKASAKKK
jgi:hypothetical protein